MIRESSASWKKIKVRSMDSLEPVETVHNYSDSK